MIPTPTYMNANLNNSPQKWEMSVYTDGYTTDITESCGFEFTETPPVGINIVKNKIVIDKKAPRFQSQIRVKYRKEEKLVSFFLK